MGNHTVSLVDFGDTYSLSAACCGPAHLHRGRWQRLSDVKLEELLLTKEELARLDQEAAAELEGGLDQWDFDRCTPGPEEARDPKKLLLSVPLGQHSSQDLRVISGTLTQSQQMPKR
jgi:hypothetical protein